jgi:hypothetical protein
MTINVSAELAAMKDLDAGEEEEKTDGDERTEEEAASKDGGEDEGDSEGEGGEGEASEGEGEEVADDDQTSILELQAKMEVIQAQLTQALAATKKVEEEEQIAPWDDQDFMKDVEGWEDVGIPREVMNGLLNRVGKAAYAKGQEDTIKRVPRLVKKNVSDEVSTHSTVTDFFRANRDILPHREYAAVIYAQLEAQNPNKTVEERLNDTAKEVRRRLNISKNVQGAGKKSKVLPKPGSNKQRGGKPKPPDSIANEIARMKQI